MNTAIALPRMTLPTIPDLFSLDSAKKWRDQLGYSVGLAQAMTRTSERRLMEFLSMRGLMPFEPTAVLTYKSAKRAEMPRTWCGKRRWDWHVCRFDLWEKEIPTEILDLAASLREAQVYSIAMEYLGDRNLEKVQEHYRQEEARRLLTEDPFLLVNSHRAGPWHRIAVWDEPDFSGKRLA